LDVMVVEFGMRRAGVRRDIQLRQSNKVFMRYLKVQEWSDGVRRGQVGCTEFVGGSTNIVQVRWDNEFSDVVLTPIRPDYHQTDVIPQS
jgi:hypothetical protein